VLVQEHIIYPRAVRLFIEGSLASQQEQLRTDAEAIRPDHIKKDFA